MFIDCKILSVDEDEAERAEDLGISPELDWLKFSFKLTDLLKFHEYIEGGEVKGTIIVLEDFSEYTTDLNFEWLFSKLHAFYKKPDWLLNPN